MSLKTRIQRLEKHLGADEFSARRRHYDTLTDEELYELLDSILENMLLNGESWAPEFMSQEEWAEVVREHKERMASKG